MAKKRKTIIKILAYGFLILWVLFSLVPLTTMLITALKPANTFMKYPPDYFSLKLTGENFKVVLSDSRWIKYYLDTIWIALSASAISVFVGSLAAYSFARHNFKMKKFFMIFILALQMIPAASIVIPLYNMFAMMNLLDTYLVVILVDSVGTMPLVIWLMRGYFATVPKQLEEAGYIDGCSNLQSFWKITFPLAAPGIAASAIFSFVRSFNDYIIAKTLAGGRVITYTVGLTTFSNQYEGIDMSLVSAASFTALVPVIILFAIFHKYFVIGMTGGAIKG